MDPALCHRYALRFSEPFTLIVTNCIGTNCSFLSLDLASRRNQIISFCMLIDSRHQLPAVEVSSAEQIELAHYRYVRVYLTPVMYVFSMLIAPRCLC